MEETIEAEKQEQAPKEEAPAEKQPESAPVPEPVENRANGAVYDSTGAVAR